jgi:hypothetical protein
MLRMRHEHPAGAVICALRACHGRFAPCHSACCACVMGTLRVPSFAPCGRVMGALRLVNLHAAHASWAPCGCRHLRPAGVSRALRALSFCMLRMRHGHPAGAVICALRACHGRFAPCHFACCACVMGTLRVPSFAPCGRVIRRINET